MNMGLLNSFIERWSLLERKLLPSYVWNADPLTFWRERILFVICFTAALLGPIALVPSTALAIHERLWGVCILDIVSYLMVVALLFARNLPLRLRTGTACLVLYTLGIWILFALGPSGAGYIWLFGASVIVGSFMGLHASVFALILNALVLAAVAVFIYYGSPEWTAHVQNPLQKWAVMAVNFLLINSVVTITTALMLNGLRTALVKEQNTSVSLQESEIRYQLLAENTYDVIWLMDMELMFTYVNPAIRTIMGYDPMEWIGSRLSDYCRESCTVKIQSHLDRLLQKNTGKEKSIVEVNMKNRDGNDVTLEVSQSLIFDHSSRPVAIQGVARDVTERKLFEARLRQAQKMEAVGTLAGGIAHDFNNILFPVMGMAELLLQDVPKHSVAYENAKEILIAGRRGTDLVRQILAFSRRSEHKKGVVRLQPLLDEVLRLARSTIPTNIEINRRIDDHCGPVLANPTQVHQIVMNLLTNAYHAVEKTGGNIWVYLRAVLVGANELPDSSLRPGRCALLTISDTGCGIKPEVMSKIFEPYFTTKEQGKGTGLGLAVAYGIVKEYGGDIKVYSELGQGTSFNIYLPLSDESPETAEEEKHEQFEVGNERILLVDDEEVIVSLETQMLERLGYIVTPHSNSLDALEDFKISPESFDLVITDMSMPNMTGAQFAKKIISIRPDVPVIICSGYSEAINHEKADEMGISGFLMKPIIISEMAKTVRGTIDEAKTKRAG